MSSDVGRNMDENVAESRVYQNIVSEIARIEKSLKKDSPITVKSRLRLLYNDLLTRWPCLEGFWVRWAHTEFKIESLDAALNVFHLAQKHDILLHSVILWTEYLKFKLRVCQPDLNALKYEMESASRLIGSHFLSHEFWNLYIEVADSPTNILESLLTDLTLHQFSFFYAYLLELYSERTVGSGETFEPPEKLLLTYNLHSRRVKQVLPFEQRIKRPFFYPSKQTDAEVWLEYAKAVEDPTLIYYRALVPGYLNPKIWLSFIRYYIRTGADQSTIRALYEMSLNTGLTPILLHYALWLEYTGENKRASEVYQKAISNGHKTAIRQHSQFCDRQGILVPGTDSNNNNNNLNDITKNEDNGNTADIDDDDVYYDEDL